MDELKGHCFFAVDLGATSGRTIVGTLRGGKAALEEISRFPNHITEADGHYYWNLTALRDGIVAALRRVAERGIAIDSIGIDTWGVDFALLGADGQLLSQPRSYRDPDTFAAMDDYLQNVASRESVYAATGIQFLNFNSLFQFHAMRRAGNDALQRASQILFIPDALSYMLTGEAVCEYTIASTSQLLNPRTGELDGALLASIGLERRQFGRMVRPGTVIGTLTPDVQQETGLGAVPVIAVAGHDTASAVAAVPAKSEQFAYLSSGTWSLMGIETPKPIITPQTYERNFTNEGGIEGTTRFLKNICGMWLLERCRAEWQDAPTDYAQLFSEAAEAEPFRSLINPDDPRFANPPQMIEAIRSSCHESHQPVPADYRQLTRCILDSLALRYKQVFGYLQELAPFPLRTLHIIGGGSRNTLLNQFTANATGAEVVAGPAEGTALGNIMVQAKAAGAVADVWEMRRVVAESSSLSRFLPQDTALWQKGYEKFLKL